MHLSFGILLMMHSHGFSSIAIGLLPKILFFQIKKRDLKHYKKNRLKSASLKQHSVQFHHSNIQYYALKKQFHSCTLKQIIS